MGCICILDNAQPLQLCSQTLYFILVSCITLTFTWYLLFIKATIKKLAVQRYDIIRRNEA